MANNIHTHNNKKSVTGTTSGNKNSLDVNASNLNTTVFDELKTVSRYAQIELKSAVGAISNLRNSVTQTNATVSVSSTGEYLLSTNATTSAIAQLESGERGRYIPGYEAECGVGIRIPAQTWAGTQYTEWGYFDDQNGFGYGKDATGNYIFVKRGGSKTKTYQTAWNTDKLDGTGNPDNPSNFNLDYADGVITQIEYVWYGYGAIRFIVNVKDETVPKGSLSVVIHTILPIEQTSIQPPNLPINVILENGDQATSRQVYVGGRQYSIYGSPTEKFRINGESRSTFLVTNTAWTPLISMRRKTGEGNNQSVELYNVGIIPTGNIVYTFVTGGSLTGASFGNFSDVATTETAVEVDVNASAITGGTFFGGKYIALGNTKTDTLTELSDLNFNFVNSDAVTLVAKSIGASATIDLCVMNVKEKW